MIEIPFVTYPAVSEDISMDNVVYRVQCVWNTRKAFWSLSLFDTDDNPVLTGIKLVINYELIAMYRHLDIPQGELYVLDLNENVVDNIKYSDFSGERKLKLIYMEPADLV